MALVGSQWPYFTDPPFRPAHGSQPGPQAGRHVLEGAPVRVERIGVGPAQPRPGSPNSESLASPRLRRASPRHITTSELTLRSFQEEHRLGT